MERTRTHNLAVGSISKLRAKTLPTQPPRHPNVIRSVMRSQCRLSRSRGVTWSPRLPNTQSPLEAGNTTRNLNKCSTAFKKFRMSCDFPANLANVSETVTAVVCHCSSSSSKLFSRIFLMNKMISILIYFL